MPKLKITEAQVDTAMRALVIERVSVDDLILDPRNARKHPDKNLVAIKTSLKKFGQQKPIVVSVGGVVVAGNGTLQAAKELGWEWIDVVRTKLNRKDATAFAIADNRTAELAEWDHEVLSQLLTETGEIGEEDGWGAEDIGALAALLEDPLPPGSEIEDPGLGDAEDEPPPAPKHTCPECGHQW